MIFRSFILAVLQLGDPRFRRVFWLGLLLTLVLLIAAFAGFLALIEYFVDDQPFLPILGEVRWLDDLLSIGAVVLLILFSMFLMIPVASAITSMFLDDVAQAVEDLHYPDLPPVTRVPFGDAVRDTVNFLGILIAVNIAAFIVYVFVTPVAPFVFYGVNGWLLGREYFMLAAMRRIGRQGARELWRANRGRVWIAGCLMATPLTIPLVNLVIPILGAATFTHIFHAIHSGRRPAG